jgi:ribonuclease VapC
VIVDASAIIAVFLREPGYERVVDRLIAAKGLGCGTPTLVEAGIVLSAKLGTDARGLLGRFVATFGIVEIPFGEDHWREAVGAFTVYGKGRHKAALNFGDCMSYAVARLADQPLLCTGSDFARTDIELA